MRKINFSKDLCRTCQKKTLVNMIINLCRVHQKFIQVNLIQDFVMNPIEKDEQEHDQGFSD